MPPLTYSRRLALAFGAMIFVCLLTSPLLLWWWWGTVLALLIQVGTASLLVNVLYRYVAQNCLDFQNVFGDLRKTLSTGKRGLQLKSLRANDAFGTLANEINELVDEAAMQVSTQLGINRDLEQNKTLFQSILGTMVEGVLVLDSHRHVLYFNETARRMLDCTSRNFVGRPIWEVVRMPGLTDVVNAAYEAEAPIRQELELQRNKSVVDVSAASLPLQPEPGVVIVLHDVTEVRRLERMRREFVSNVSHELKTPLTSIQLYADTLMDEDSIDPEQGRLFLSRILEQTDRLQKLIQDMLRLARIESQSEAFKLAPFSVQTILKNSISARIPLAEAKQIELRVNDIVPAVEVFADTDGLQTIFDNLIGNAINYTPEGGRVTVDVQLVGDNIEVAVEDTGIGISSEHLSRIFERFYRVDKVRTGGQGGTGLGLAIVKHLVSVFQGEIEVRSELGHGSRFLVRLPLHRNS